MIKMSAYAPISSSQIPDLPVMPGLQLCFDLLSLSTESVLAEHSIALVLGNQAHRKETLKNALQPPGAYLC